MLLPVRFYRVYRLGKVEKMKDCAKVYLSQKGYFVNSNALDIIQVCDNWYANREIEEFHVRTNLNGQEVKLSRMNFAKRCCADDANLCEIISVSPTEGSAAKEFIEQLLRINRFDVRYREQLEKISATGTAGAYLYLKDSDYLQNTAGNIMAQGGQIRINYVDADCIFPLTVENGLVTECAFCATNLIRDKEKTTLVIFTQSEGKYQAETAVFDDQNQIIDAESSVIQLGEIKPFAIMTNAEVNNLDNMDGYGLPKIYNSIPLFKAMDLCYNILYGDIDKGQKLVFINELLACIQTDKDGRPYLTKQQKELFILLGQGGGKMPDEKTLVQEYNPKIRVEEITKAFELVLSLLSMSFGYGTKKYTFDKTGQVKTATECIIDNQQAMQELNKQRKQAVDYVTDIVHAAMWFSNAFLDTDYDCNEEISVDFDDSIITDKAAELESLRNDALTFDIPKLTVMYLVKAYNFTEEEATALVEKKQNEEEKDTDGEEED